MEVSGIKKNNENLADRLEQKTEHKKSKKERSKYLLNCIIEKLEKIQRQVQARKGYCVVGESSKGKYDDRCRHTDDDRCRHTDADKIEENK